LHGRRVLVLYSHRTFPCDFAQACLGVLLSLDDRSDKDSVEKIPLLRYAAEYWFQHAQVGDVEVQIKDTMDHFFDMDKPHFSAWVRIRDLEDLLKVSMDEEPSAVPLQQHPYTSLRGGDSVI
jgi:inorganic pyrophosphatase